MRWKNPKDGDTRMKTWFAWFPVQIGIWGRWLETVTCEQTYQVFRHAARWSNEAFVDIAREENDG